MKAATYGDKSGDIPGTCGDTDRPRPGDMGTSPPLGGCPLSRDGARGKPDPGGWLSGSIEYARRAVEYAPRDRETLRVAVRELRSRGLTPIDIERALRLHPTAVADLLAEPAGE